MPCLYRWWCVVPSVAEAMEGRGVVVCVRVVGVETQDLASVPGGYDYNGILPDCFLHAVDAES
jgi:hypothetical protein